MKTSKAKRSDRGLKENEKKWGKALWAPGWSAIPVVILKYQRELGLSANDINVILHLVRHWWTAERLPYPSKQEIADCMKISPSTVQRRIRKLQDMGYVKRIKRFESRSHRQTSNEYDLAGLVKEATRYAEKEMEDRAERDAAKRKRKPKLRIA